VGVGGGDSGRFRRISESGLRSDCAKSRKSAIKVKLAHDCLIGIS
jgi:hypothetical protein